jgi:riboflavin kinase/FMN adenylyltransferase
VIHPSITNIGIRPTVDASGRTSIETHVFGLNRDLYNASLRVGFVLRLRDERAFDSLDLLKAQIAADCERARALFGQLSL